MTTSRPEAGELAAAMAFLRRRLVGVPPNVDMEDAWMASLLDEAEQVGRAATPRQDELEAALERERDLRQALLEGSYFHITHDRGVRYPETCGDCRALAEQAHPAQEPTDA